MKQTVELIDKNGESSFVDVESTAKFFEFCRDHSTHISVSKVHAGKLTTDQIDKIKIELDNDVKTQKEAYEYNKNGYADRLKNLLFIENGREADAYFEDMKRENSIILKSLNYISNQGTSLDLKLLQKKGLIDYRTTCITPVTKGVLFDICYFYSNALKDEMSVLLDIYESIIINEMSFEDIVFYRDSFESQNVLASVLSHERQAQLMLDDSEISEFKEMMKA